MCESAQLRFASQCCSCCAGSSGLVESLRTTVKSARLLASAHAKQDGWNREGHLRVVSSSAHVLTSRPNTVLCLSQKGDASAESYCRKVPGPAAQSKQL